MQGQALPFARSRDDLVLPSGETRVIDSLRELVRNGYVADPDAPIEAEGILLRHDVAPDLVLFADGRIELPVGPLPKRGSAKPKTKAEKRISWRRTLLVLVVAAIAWTMSVFLGVAFLSS
jgi:hypothetical protein